MGQHDLSYRAFFVHRRMIQDLLREIVGEQWVERIDRWNREIREEGRQEGEARLMLRQLRLKFGPLEPGVEERVRSADAECLLEWGERVLTAERLEDVFRG